MTDWLTIGLPQVAVSALPMQASEVAEVAHRIGWSITITDHRSPITGDPVAIDPACGQDQGTGASQSTVGALSLSESLFLKIVPVD